MANAVDELHLLHLQACILGNGVYYIFVLLPEDRTGDIDKPAAFLQMATYANDYLLLQRREG